MPITNAPRSRSPYTVHQGGRFVCQAPDLYALSAVLEELATRFQVEERGCQRLSARREVGAGGVPGSCSLFHLAYASGMHLAQGR